MIYEDIKNFPKQFVYKPVIENGPPHGFKKFIVVGMGGSNLAADLVKILRPDLNIVAYRDYGLPEYLTKDTLVVLSSYSGNTEEVLDAYRAAGEKKLPRVAIGAAGKLLELAEKEGVPYIRFPERSIQPRVALGWSFLALLKVVGDEKLLKETAGLARTLSPAGLEKEAAELAGFLKNRVPVIYASCRNKGLSYIWKIVFNETAKVPAFANVFPELNHNEMTSFAAEDGAALLSLRENFSFLIIKDESDGQRILKRMEVLKSLYEKRGFKLRFLELQGSALEKIWRAVILAHFTAYHLASSYGVEPEAVPLVEEFKKLIK